MNRDPYSIYDRQAAWAALIGAGLFLAGLAIWLPWWVMVGALALWLMKNCVTVRVVRRKDH